MYKRQDDFGADTLNGRVFLREQLKVLEVAVNFVCQVVHGKSPLDFDVYNFSLLDKYVLRINGTGSIEKFS